MKKWSIAYVNYKTSIYMKWQLKGLYEFNNPNDFELIIVDNSRPHEAEALEKIIKPYQEKYNNIKIIYYKPIAIKASDQHGEALDVAKEYATAKYFLTQDPDFFWVKQNYLKWFESFLDKDFVAIGAPYQNKTTNGHPYFPCAYGCAHPLKLIKDITYKPDFSDESLLEIKNLSQGYIFSRDVGWQIRVALSTPKSTNFISFDQRKARELFWILGTHSYEFLTREYMFNNKTVAFHLFRGSFTGEVKDFIDENKKTPEKWLDIREQYSQYFYRTLKKGVESSILRYIYKNILVLFSYLPYTYKREIARVLFKIFLNKKFNYEDFNNYLRCFYD